VDQRSRRVRLPHRSTNAPYQTRNAHTARLRRTRFAVRAGREHLDDDHRQILRLLRRHRHRLWRTWELKEQLRDLYRSTDPVEARAYLKRWCTAAKRSRIPAFANLIRRIEKHFDAIIAAVELGLSTFNLENLDETPPGERPSLTERIALMSPQIVRLRTDVACFLEVHGQERPGAPRALLAWESYSPAPTSTGRRWSAPSRKTTPSTTSATWSW
jgi:Transposase